MEISFLLSLIGLVTAVVLLIYLCYNEYQPIILAPLAAILISTTSGIGITEGVLGHFAQGFANMSRNVLFVFICSTLFGGIMVATKSTHAIAKWISSKIGYKYAPTIIFLSSLILGIGGMNAGAWLTIYPVAMILCSKANYSKDIILGAIMSGTFAISLSAPFMPSPNNALLMSFLGTGPDAGLVPGLAAAFFMMIATIVYLEVQVRVWAKKGRVFVEWDEVPKDNPELEAEYPPVWKAITPILIVLFAFNVLRWPLPISITCGAISSTLFSLKKFTPKEWLKVWEEGANHGVGPFINLAMLAGIGTLVMHTPVFVSILGWLATSNIHPYVLAIVAANVVAMCLGSASSAIAVAMPALAPIFHDMVATRGVCMGNIHRLFNLGSIGLDTLPHNGGIIACCRLFNTTHKKSYPVVFLTSIVEALAAAFLIALPLALLGFN